MRAVRRDSETLSGAYEIVAGKVSLKQLRDT